VATSMLTKLLRGESTKVAQPLTFPRASGPVTNTTTVAAVKSNPDHALENSAGGGDQTAILQARIAELGATMERRVREVRDAAYREGEAAGKNQAATQVQPMLDKLAKSIQEIAELRPKLRHEAEADVVKLSLAIAKKILHRELNTDADSIAGLIKAAIEKIRMHDIVRVRIHPQHQASVQQILGRMSAGHQIEVLPDPKLQTGGVVVETSRGEFDASVDLQLREIERGLTDRLASHK
jgi:flagellar assembly protein FliH